MSRSHLPAVVCLVLCLCSTARAQPSPRRYSVTQIPSAGYDFAHIFGMNERGHAVGVRVKYHSDQDSENYGFFWSKETGVVDLGLNYRPLAMNNHDEVVGVHFDRAAGHSSWKWTRASGFASVPLSRVYDINDAGQMLGITEVYPAPKRGVVLNPDGTSRTLPLVAGAKDVSVATLTPAGGAVGSMTTENAAGNSQYLGAIWPATGGYELLHGLPAWMEFSFAGETNGRGMTVGSSMVPDILPEHGMQRAVYWDADGVVHDMGTLPNMITSGTAGINESGEVVGWSAGFAGSGSPPWRGFLFTTGEGMVDLTDLIDDPGRNYIITHGKEITDSGLIAADAYYGGKSVAVILERLPNDAPNTPEPGGLLVVAGAALLLRRQR